MKRNVSKATVAILLFFVIPSFANEGQDTLKNLVNEISAKPRSSKAHYNLGHYFLIRNKPRLAIDSFKKALQFNANYGLAHAGLGIAYADIQSYKNAETELKAALNSKKQKLGIYKYEIAYCLNKIGMVYYKNKKMKQAIPFFVKSIQLEPRNFDVSTNLANSFCFVADEHFMLGNSENSIKFYKKALSIDRHFQRAEKGLAQVYVGLAIQAQQKNELVFALNHYKLALKYDKHNIKIRRRFAELHFKLNNKAKRKKKL